jgi:hypothetical protein
VRTDRETRTLGRLGLVGLFVALIVGMAAPVIGGLDSSSHGYERVRLEPGASLPLSGDAQVVLDSGDGQTRIGDCSIAGPGAWDRQIIAAGKTTDIRTGPDGSYRITCQGGAVEVENNASGDSIADPKENQGHRITIALLVVAGLIGVAGLGVLVTSSRVQGQRDGGEGGSSRGEIESETGADEPEAH